MKEVLRILWKVHMVIPQSELEVFGEVEDDIVIPETISNGLDDEVPEDRDEEDPTGRPMVTMEVIFIWVRGFPCVVCGEGLVDKVGLKQHMNWHHCFLVASPPMQNIGVWKTNF